MRDLKITEMSVTALTPYARNARTRSKKQIKQIAASIERFGWTKPVLIDAQDQIRARRGQHYGMY